MEANGNVPRPSNYLKRYDFAQKLIGRKVKIVSLGDIDPANDPTVERYLPLPEYGIALVEFKRETSEEK